VVPAEGGFQIVKDLHHVTFEAQKTLIGCRVLVQKSEALKRLGSLKNSEEHLGGESVTGLGALGSVEGLEIVLGPM